jgi:L-asparaginase/Glu-tRNA(Gln) amidotransferase subunit D
VTPMAGTGGASWGPTDSESSGLPDAAARSRVNRRVGYLATGGTIASRSGPDGWTASERADSLVQSLNNRPPGIEISARDLHI